MGNFIGLFIFNNREISIGFWSLIFFIWCLSKKEIRHSILDVIKIVFSKWIIIIFVLSTTYIGIVIFLLYKLKFWNIFMLKDSIIWYIFVSSSMIMKGMLSKKEEKFFRNEIIECFSLTLMFDLVINTFDFGLLIEIIVFPIILIVVLMIEFGKHRKEYEALVDPMNKILNFSGIIIIVYSVLSIIKNYKIFFTINSLKAFLLPQILILMYLPFIYIMFIYSKYETIFEKFKIPHEIPKTVVLYIKLRIILKYNFYVYNAEEFFLINWYKIRTVRTKKEFDIILNNNIQ